MWTVLVYYNTLWILVPIKTVTAHFLNSSTQSTLVCCLQVDICDVAPPIPISSKQGKVTPELTHCWYSIQSSTKIDFCHLDSIALHFRTCTLVLAVALQVYRLRCKVHSGLLRCVSLEYTTKSTGFVARIMPSWRLELSPLPPLPLPLSPPPPPPPSPSAGCCSRRCMVDGDPQGSEGRVPLQLRPEAPHPLPHGLGDQLHL